MADYYSIVNKTISGLAKNTPEVRQAVYGKARTAIESQLRRMSPPPGEGAISAQLNLLEEAIAVIDSEYAANELEHADIFAAPLEEPPTVSHIAPAPEIPTAAVPIDSPTASISTHAPLEPDVTSSHPTLDTPLEARGGAKSGGLGKALTYLVILAVLGAGGYGLWTNRDTLQPMVTSFFDEFGGTASDTGQETVASNNTESAQDESSGETSEVRNAEDNAEKEPIRLGPNGEDEVAETENTDQAELETTEVPTVLDQPDTPENQTGTEPEVDPVQENQTGEGEAENAVVPSASNALGEIAYLYEEGSAGSGATRSSATVSWSLASLKLLESLPAEPVIVGKMEIPEKGVSVDINIKRNIDPALSASHLIDITFEIPDGFVGGSVDNIARFVMKPSEEARGEPLVAVPVKVSDGYFLVALDNLDQAIQVNTQLLLSSDWIDIPISYTTGRRALLTLEKGGTGEQVFKEAFDDWKNR
ncbi:MAG: hypothetical protein ACR2O3_01430 [Rhizobiaceae bacterium]